MRQMPSSTWNSCRPGIRCVRHVSEELPDRFPGAKSDPRPADPWPRSPRNGRATIAPSGRLCELKNVNGGMLAKGIECAALACLFKHRAFRLAKSRFQPYGKRESALAERGCDLFEGPAFHFDVNVHP